jgi:hypothetical protein
MQFLHGIGDIGAADFAKNYDIEMVDAIKSIAQVCGAL